MVFKILVIAIAAFFVLRSLINFQQKRIDLMNFLIWLVVWIGVIVFMIHPTFADQLAKFTGISRGTDVVFFVAFLIMFYFIFRLYTKITAVESDVTETVKYIALINHKLDRQKKRQK